MDYFVSRGQQQVQLKMGKNIVGRVPNAEILLSVSPNPINSFKNPSVSKQHACIELDNGVVTLANFNPTNATRLNGRFLAKHERVIIKPGDIIKFALEDPFSLVGPPQQKDRVQPPAPLDPPTYPGSPPNKNKFDIREEKISLTNPRNWIENKVSERMNEQSILQQYASGMQDKERKIKQLEEMEDQRKNVENLIRSLKEKNENLERQIAEKDNSKREIEDKINSLSSDTDKESMRSRAYENFASEIQKKISSLQSSESEKIAILKKLNKKEFIKIYESEQKTVQSKRLRMYEIENEIQMVKNQIKNIPSQISSQIQSTEHLSSMIEKQYDELCIAKKQLIEHEAREAICQNQWNNLIKENVQKDERIKGVKLQIERNLDNMQLLMSDHDHQLYELCKRLFEVIGEQGTDEQQEAAYFLVEQLPLLQEERRAVIMENEQFHLSNQEVINNIEMLKSEIDRLRILFDNDVNLEDAHENQIIAALKTKLERIIGKIEDEKNSENVSAITGRRGAVETLEKRIFEEFARKVNLEKNLKVLVSKHTFTDKKSIMEFFGKLVNQKDTHIQKLAQHIDLLKTKEKDQQLTLDLLKNKVEIASTNYNELKNKQTSLSDSILKSNMHTN